jgi:hypothetical protein
MPDWLMNSLAAGQELDWWVLCYRLGLAFVLGIAVAAIYWATHRRDESLASSFIATLVLLAILIAMVTQVIGDNIARAFSLVGALSIVRFRTVVEDTRDTAFVIFAVIVGMAVGAGHLAVALVGLPVVGLAAVLTSPRRRNAGAPSGVWNLTIRIGLGPVPGELLDSALREHFEEADLVATSTGRQGAALDLSYRVRLRGTTSPAAIAAALNRLEGVQSVELQRR